MADYTEQESKWFSRLQSERAQRPRNRTSLARMAVRFVLREAPLYPGTRTSVDPKGRDRWGLVYGGSLKRGRNLARYRHFVGCECRLHGKDIDLELTVIEDEYGRPMSHEFFCNVTFRREQIADATLRKIVRQITLELSEN